MSEDLMRYDRMVEDAMRGVVRAALQRTAAEGLPGEHHFYITFHTEAEGVEIPGWLRERYPEEMTIVLQHRFRDLEVGESGFSVTLSFNEVPARLVVPYSAIGAFADPSVRFGFTFAQESEGEDEAAEAAGDETAPPESDAAGPDAPESEKPDSATAESDEAAAAAGDETVVSLDRFRKTKG